MIVDAWEVREGPSGYIVEARTDDDRNYVQLLLLVEEDAEDLVAELNSKVHEVRVIRA